MRKATFCCVSAILLVTLHGIVPGAALSSTTPPSRQFIELTKASSLPNDRLPASFISHWPTWVLDPSASSTPGKWSKIPDTDDGFVPPTSIDQLWQPMDLKLPTCQLAVGLHVRDGTIRHVLPALDLTLHDQHRNRGLCSVPRAYHWMDFASLALGGGIEACRLVLQSRESSDTTWSTLAILDSIKVTVDSAVNALADDPPAELGDGSSVIHVLCNENVGQNIEQTIPKAGSDLRALLLEEDGTIMGALEVAVAQTAAGSESEYLPEAYEPLFEDESLRRPAFVEMKRRMQEKQE